MQYQFHPRLFNPLFWHLLEALRDENIRYIYVEGGSSAAKTYSICQALMVDMYQYEYNTAVFRRFHIDIADYVYASFKMVRESLEFQDYYKCQQDLMKSSDGVANIVFKGLDDEDRVKGMENINVVYMNEWNQFTEAQWGQMRKRLRGRTNQKFICDWNPISSELWNYKSWLDVDEWQDMPLSIDNCPTKYNSLNPEYAFKRKNKKGDSIWIKVTYRDNYWIVGHPSGKGGYVDEHILADFERDRIHKPNLYRIYANGERGVIRTGGEFWVSFNEVNHIKPISYVPGRTLHVSCDQNADPYVTLSIWQPIGDNIRQIHELPCYSPDNNAPRSARKLAVWLRHIGYTDVLYVYGDPSGNNRSTVDYNSSSFFDKFIEELIENGVHVNNRVARAHPEVALSAAFINDIYEFGYGGYSITISDNCKVSCLDYSVVQIDKDGTMLKTKVKDKASGRTYEPHGHFSDAKRYFITTYLGAEFKQYKVRGRNRMPISVDY